MESDNNRLGLDADSRLRLVAIQRVLASGLSAWMSLCVFGCGERTLTTHFSPDAFIEPHAREFAQAVADGRIETALTAARSAPGGVNTLGRNGETGLLLAVERLNRPMIAALVKAGANPNGGPNRAPIHEAVKAANLAMAQELLAAGADPNGQLNGEPALYEAALIGNLESVRLLLSSGATIDKPGPGGETAAIGAAGADNWQMVLFLVSAGASLAAADSAGFTIGAFASHSRIRRDGAEGAALTAVIERLKKQSFPWPPPSPPEVLKLRALGKWPPK
jgi:hypothetical protein